MRNVIADYFAGCTRSKTDGCFDTPAGLSHHASRFLVSSAHNHGVRNLLPPAQIDDGRYRPRLARYLIPVLAKPLKFLTIFCYSIADSEYELQPTISCSHHARSVPVGEAEHLSLQLSIRTSGSGSWTDPCILPFRQILQKWIRGIWSSISLSSLRFLQVRCEREGFSHYA